MESGVSTVIGASVGGRTKRGYAACRSRWAEAASQQLAAKRSRETLPRCRATAVGGLAYIISYRV